MTNEELLKLLDDLIYAIDIADKWEEIYQSKAFKKAKEIVDNN